MAKKLTSAKAKEILRDKSVHGNPLTEKQRKFFGAIAGGAEPYKAQIGTMLTSLPSNWGDRLSDVLSFPQRAITKLFTGKYQEPSEALGIKAPLAAMATNMILDPANLITGGSSSAAKAAKAVSKAEKLATKSKDLSKYLTSELRDKGYSLLHNDENLLDLYNNKKRVGRLEVFSQPNTDIKGNKWASINVDIDPSHRGLGLSKPLYSAALEEARRKGFSGFLSVDELLQSPEKSKAIRKHFPGEYSTDKNLLQKTNKIIDEDNEFARELEQTNLTPRAKQVYLIGTPKKKQDGGWLDKYEQGGLVLKQKTHDNYGKKPNANESNVTLPPGFKGWAYNTKGRNYSPAWGGQFAMGGNLPGATGMMYARTINPAPSNGPYAKKTKASAQDGKKLSYSAWKKKHNLKETEDYNLKRAWELGYTPDKTGHLPTVDNQTGEFLKAKGHPTLQLEIDWYNSPEAADFRSKNVIDSSGKFFKYIPKGQNGQEMKYYQEGLDFKPKTISQDGTVIDPMGYWNPENIGNPVIIPSNEITMQGVYKPLIGVSDTGDVQYMQPGEDYMFDGNYVTEYPMAKGGISVNEADAQPIKKLDQLLNFTNYNKPTKGGWLDKYQ